MRDDGELEPASLHGRDRALALARARPELLVLVALALWTLLPIIALVARARIHGGVFTGVTGLDPYDQFQYLAWIRDAGEHGLSSNLFGLTGGGHVFLQPMYLISGLLWRAGIGLQLAYLLWAPVAVGVLWLGFSAYARRMEPSSGRRRLAVLVLGLAFATPLGWFTLPPTKWVTEMAMASTDATAALQPWFAMHTAIAIGLMPLVLLGCERIVQRNDASSDPGSGTTRPVILTAAGAALVSWLHSWQGATLALVIGVLFLLRLRHTRDLRLLPVLLACAAPLAYQLILTKVDPAWKLAASLNRRPDLFYISPQLAVLGPLLAGALLGALGWWRWPVLRRSSSAGPNRQALAPGEQMLLLWPIAAFAVYRFDPEFPLHALQGVTLPLAVLAVRAWPARRSAVIAGVALLLIFTIPGLASFVRSFKDVERADRQLFFTPPRDHAAFRYLASAPAAGAVLAPLPLALEVPAFTGRSVWAGHQIWTPDPTRPQQVARLYGGDLSATQAQRFVRATGARFVLADCDAAGALEPKLASITSAVHRFGCVSVIELR